MRDSLWNKGILDPNATLQDSRFNLILNEEYFLGQPAYKKKHAG